MNRSAICMIVALSVIIPSCGSSSHVPTGGSTADPTPGSGVTGTYIGTLTSGTTTVAAYVKLYQTGSTLFMMPSQTQDFSAAKEFMCAVSGATLTCSYEEDHVDATDPRSTYHRVNTWSGLLSGGQWVGDASTVITYPNAPTSNIRLLASFRVKK